MFTNIYRLVNDWVGKSADQYLKAIYFEIFTATTRDIKKWMPQFPEWNALCFYFQYFFLLFGVKM